MGFSVENIVYFELLRVNVGKSGNAGVDFVAEKQGVIYYWQVTADMTSEGTLERELRSLRKIADSYSKTVLTLDRFSAGNYDGSRVVNVINRLTGNAQ